MKRYVCSLLCVLLMLGSVTAYASSEPAAIDFTEAPYTLHVCYAVMSEAQPDLALIEAKLNEATLKEINVKVELEAVSLFNMANIYALKASSQEKMDLIMLMPGYTYLANFASSNLIQPIDEAIEKWGTDIKAAIGDKLAAGQFQGKQYAIPQIPLIKNGFGFNFNKAILDKYDIDVSAIKSLGDLDPIFELVHANEPDMIILMPESTGGNIASILMGAPDGLGSNFGGLRNRGLDDTKVVNIFETDEYVAAVKKVREWYLKGYISKDVTTTQESGSRMFMGGNVFSTAIASVNAAMGFTQPLPATAILIEEPTMMTADSQLFLWAVPTSAQRPDKAVQFINLLDASAELTKLMRFGIEGTHYEVNADGIIDASKNANWRNYWMMFGDEAKLPVYLGDLEALPAGTTPEQFREMQAAWNANTKVSKAYGFTFDPTPVKMEIAACDAVNNEFAAAIGNGTVDPETEIKKFSEKLYAAGLQKIIDEKQRQLDEWLAMK